MVSGHWHLTSSLRRLTSFQLHSKMTSAHFKTFVATTFWSLLLFVEGQGREGRLVHGKYFGPLNETSPFSKDIRHDEIETGWFSQPLDHFNRNDRRKWNQKFARNATFFRRGGPACITISGESAMDPRWIVVGQSVNYCRNFNAVMFMLEHRYYGDSKPTRDATVESLKYLTISQALRDIARFIEFVQHNEVHKIEKVILFGGSYAGTLVGYFRQTFPNLPHISVASSAPIVWKYDFTEYMEVVGKVLKQYGNCYDRVESGMRKIEKVISDAITAKHAGPINHLLSPLKLCSDLYVTNKMDVLNFYSAISTIFGYYTQYNGASYGVMTVKDICDSISTGGQHDNFHALAKLLQRMYYSLEYDCIEFSNKEYCDFASKTSWDDPAVAHGSRIWNWQLCSEVASFQTTNSKNQPFFGLTTDLFVAQCQCAFGEKFSEAHVQNAVDRHAQLFGGYQASRPNVIFVNGENDPWSALSVIDHRQIYITPGVSNSENCVILIKGASHCTDMTPDRIPPQPGSSAVQQAHYEIFRCIKKWMENS